jgi:[Skp1-protein]-hydroxyproline N-acetylglucosaminyltransferase
VILVPLFLSSGPLETMYDGAGWSVRSLSNYKQNRRDATSGREEGAAVGRANFGRRSRCDVTGDVESGRRRAIGGRRRVGELEPLHGNTRGVPSANHYQAQTNRRYHRTGSNTCNSITNTTLSTSSGNPVNSNRTNGYKRYHHESTQQQTNAGASSTQRRHYRQMTTHMAMSANDTTSSIRTHKSSHRIKRTSAGAHHGEMFVFVRVFITVIILSAVLCVVVSFLLGIMFQLPSYLPSFGSSSMVTRRRDASFVQNDEEIRHVLEMATSEYVLLSGKTSNLHSVRREQETGMFETILHPGDLTTQVSVPRFYASVSVSVDGGDGPVRRKLFREWTQGKLLTPELASLIGSSTSDSDIAEGRSIFVSIISRDDVRCSTTVSNLLSTATNPHRIRIAVVDRTSLNNQDHIACDEPPQPCNLDSDQMLCVHRDQVDVYELGTKEDAGAMFARHIAQRMYRGEYYAMMIGNDAGIAFTRGWDVDLITQFNATNNDMAIITTYLTDAYKYGTADAVEVQPERITLCHASYDGFGLSRRLQHLREDQVEQVAPSMRSGAPMLQPYWSAEFSFSRGHFILNVPYDQHLCGLNDQEEDFSMAVRAFSHGYDFYTPTHSSVYRYSHERGKHTGDNDKLTCKASVSCRELV